MKYKIVADSSANVLERQGIDYVSVPLKVITDQNEYIDSKETDISKMVADLQAYKGRSGTSCPNPADWLKAFGEADIILGVTITSQLSGSYASAVQAKQEYEEKHPEAHVLIVDSLSAGPELALIIEKFEDMVRSEKPFEDIKKEIYEYHKQTHLLFALERMDNLARNGRCHPLVAKMAGVLGIRLVGKASDEGTLQPLHKCRGAQRTIASVWSEMQKAGFNGGKVRIAHCFNLEGAQTLSEVIHEKYPNADVKIVPCTALCSFYAELGGLMIGYEG